MAHPGRVYSRRMLLEALWGSADFRDPRTIDVHVRHLREKLERRLAHPRIHPHRAQRRLPLPGPREPAPHGRRPARPRAARRRRRRARDRLRRRRPLLPAARSSTRGSPTCASTLAAVVDVPRLPGEVCLEPAVGRGRGRAARRRRASSSSAPAPARSSRSPTRTRGTSRDVDERPAGAPARARHARDRARPGRRAASRATPRRPTRARPRGPGRCCSRRRCTTTSSRSRSSGAACSSRARSRRCSRSCSATRSRRCSRGGSAASRRRPSGSRAGASTSRSSTPAPDELGQLARAFERMRLQLASLDRARGEFIANASHELRTPLFSLGGLPRAARERGARRRDARDEFLDDDARAGLAADEARHRPARPLAPRRRPARGRDARASTSRRSASCSRRSSGRARRATRHALELERRGPGAGARGDEERVLQIGRILVENALVHTPRRDDGRVVADRQRRRPARARRDRRRPGDPGGRARRTSSSASTGSTGTRRLGQRARPRDRPRARRADGRPDRARVRGRARRGSRSCCRPMRLDIRSRAGMRAVDAVCRPRIEEDRAGLGWKKRRESW